MAQVGKKNLNLFQALLKEKAWKAKDVGNIEVSNLQDKLVEIHVHGGQRERRKYPLSKVGRKM